MSLVIPLFIPHAGCPHHCLFCNQEKISGCGGDEGQPVDVAATINLWLARSPLKKKVQVAFYGGSFTCLPVSEQMAMLAEVQPYLVAGKVDCIRLSTRPDCISPEICQLLRDFRVGVVELGVQSFNNDVLAENSRGHTAEHCRIAFAELKAVGMEVGLQLMPGLPGETTCSFLRGIDEVVRMKPDFVRLYPVLVVKESAPEERYRKNLYQPQSLNQAIALTARAYIKLQAAGIKVVRMGLQPSESLTQNFVAGPYHPAFGELVQSRLWLKRIRARLVQLAPEENLCLYISHRDHGAVVGVKRSNIRRLEQLGYSGRFTILPDKSMARGSIEYVVC
ncbi:MAG: radical SAM protein [Proteobacteria bacterium]|nr:radical SAM protein [Pseudomonadota bacterium]